MSLIEGYVRGTFKKRGTVLEQNFQKVKKERKKGNPSESPVTFCQVRFCGQNLSKIRFFFRFPQPP